MIYPQQGDYRLVHHGGAMGGVRTNLSLVPSEQIAVVVLANRYSPVVDQITGDILTTLLPRYRRRTAEKRTASSEGQSGEESSPAAAPNLLPKQWIGTWSGTVHTYERQLTMRLSINAAGEAEAQLAQQPSAKVSALKLEDGHVTGRFKADIGTPDANKREYALLFSLKKTGDKLSGALTALSTHSPKLPNALTSWVELRRRPNP